MISSRLSHEEETIIMTTTVVLIKDTDVLGAKADRTRDMHDVLVKQLKEAGIAGSVQAIRAHELGIYNRGVAVKILPQGIVYVNVTEKDFPKSSRRRLSKAPSSRG